MERFASTKSLRILLADSHDVCRRGLQSLLMSREGWSICGQTRSGRDAVRLSSELKPDVVILDLELEELSGIEATLQIKRDQPATEVLFYTVHDEELVIAQALRAGVRGHLLKSDSEAKVIDAVAALAKHLPYFSTTAAEAVLAQLVKMDPTSNRTYLLTAREREIIQLLSDAKSNKDVAEYLHISAKTVEAHRSAIMRKLGFTSVTELVRYAIRNRLIQP
jgi:DNA-binding NarL/FixJ family response regulator